MTDYCSGEICLTQICKGTVFPARESYNVGIFESAKVERPLQIFWIWFPIANNKPMLIYEPIWTSVLQAFCQIDFVQCSELSLSFWGLLRTCLFRLINSNKAEEERSLKASILYLKIYTAFVLRTVFPEPLRKSSSQRMGLKSFPLFLRFGPVGIGLVNKYRM